MSGNRPNSPQSPLLRSLSPTLKSPIQSLAEFRLSGETERGGPSPPPRLNGLNGTNFKNGEHPEHQDDDGLGVVEKLQRELERTREEKENLATQYRNLLAKLTTMRTTLGNKLKQDAEELDRREQLVQQLSAQNEDLSSTVETLKSELISAHEEAERASHERESVGRTREFQESLARERELREAQSELERCRIERDEWERSALQERMIADEANATLETVKRDLESERGARERDTASLELETEKSNNLQSVLEDFQAAKEHDLREAVRDYETQLGQVTQSLAEYKHRALTAELKLEESNTNITRTQGLEKDVKEKNLLIGKLRHETVIINEHLMEALRRLRRNSSDTNVDRRLVTNVLLSFLTTPRADPKRFEMLSLLASILSWSDAEREKAGLQRANKSTGTSLFWGRSSTSLAKGAAELEKTDETEESDIESCIAHLFILLFSSQSFSRLWVEFLLTEAAAGSGEPTPSRSNNSLPGSPTFGHHGGQSSPGSNASPGTRRLPTLTTAAMASSPNLLLSSPPSGSRKGKEREITS